MNINQSVFNWPDGEHERTIILDIYCPQNGSCFCPTYYILCLQTVPSMVQCSSEWIQKGDTDFTGGGGFGKGYRFCLPLKIAGTGPVFCLIQLLRLQARNT